MPPAWIRLICPVGRRRASTLSVAAVSTTSKKATRTNHSQPQPAPRTQPNFSRNETNTFNKKPLVTSSYYGSSYCGVSESSLAHRDLDRGTRLADCRAVVVHRLNGIA
ncbi:hypothetical protein PM082_020675 [Marasmius tenuissimus]|nr:hypothetical protein PM082_020675 [Marasmius tenuissimus]